MSLKKWVILGVVVGTSAAVVGCLTLGLPIVRTAGYHALIREYARATPVQPASGPDQSLMWNVDLPLSNGAKVRVRARDHLDVVTIHYPDETTPKPLYEYEDYSNPVAIRRAGGKLFVYWAETLLHTDCWLLAYDLESRREIERRRVDPRDMPPTP
jgi:hypothetical protein